MTSREPILKSIFPENTRGVIVIPHMGAGNMPDFNAIQEHLTENIGVQIINADLSNPEEMRKLPWDKVSIVDLSNMRGCLTSFDKYLGILDRLNDHIQHEVHGNSQVMVIPTDENIRWIASKTKYLSHLEDRGVPVIPTQYLSTVKDPDNASIIAQSDNIPETLDKIFEFIKKSDKSRFVLKPSTSSLGRGLDFIDVLKDGSFKVITPHEGEKSHLSSFQDKEELIEKYLTGYFLKTASHDHRFLFQEYVENLETSAVFVNGKPHFVERQQGEESHIAHARFGGQDILRDPEELDRELIAFAYTVMAALPESVQNSAFLRIDVMKDLETGHYILGEIEGAGATRLWLKEANRIEDFSATLLQCALPNYANNNHEVQEDPKIVIA